jgi:hypothetical protein
MEFDDIYQPSKPGHSRNESDLAHAARKYGNLNQGIGGTRHGADVQAFGTWRWSAARSRSVDSLG